MSQGGFSMQDFQSFLRTFLEFIVVPIMGYGVVLLSDMNKNIQELNTQVAIILNERSVIREQLKDFESRIRFLETKRLRVTD